MSQEPADYRVPYLPPDIARCQGVSYPDEATGEQRWRDGCKDCLRRQAPPPGHHTTYMAPPTVIAFWCPYHIAPEPAR